VEARWRRVCLSMYSITENIYYTQLSSVALLLQPERNCFTSYNTWEGLDSFSLCAIALRSPPPQVSTCNGQRSPQLFCVHYTVIHIRTYACMHVSECSRFREKIKVKERTKIHCKHRKLIFTTTFYLHLENFTVRLMEQCA
jgi:hypothetical protein